MPYGAFCADHRALVAAQTAPAARGEHFAPVPPLGYREAGQAELWPLEREALLEAVDIDLLTPEAIELPGFQVVEQGRALRRLGPQTEFGHGAVLDFILRPTDQLREAPGHHQQAPGIGLGDRGVIRADAKRLTEQPLEGADLRRRACLVLAGVFAHWGKSGR